MEGQQKQVFPPCVVAHQCVVLGLDPQGWDEIQCPDTVVEQGLGGRLVVVEVGDILALGRDWVGKDYKDSDNSAELAAVETHI